MRRPCSIGQVSVVLALGATALLPACQTVKYVLAIEPPPTGAAPPMPYPSPKPAGDSNIAPPEEIIADESATVLRRPTELESGLVIEVVRTGAGAKCELDSQVMVHYSGTLEDESVFDETAEDEPRGPWPVEHLMPGWRQGIIGMRAGGKRKLVIPPALAYGEQAITDPETGDVVIPSNATLTYVIELVDVR